MTVSIGLIQNFDQFSLETATHIIYKEIIPRCEANSIKLSCYGNHASKETICSVEKYDEEKKENRLFNIERIQKAFKCLDEVISKAALPSVGSYYFKHVVEKHQKDYITNGDCIVAMLLKGYKADFGFPFRHVNCQFTLKSIT